MSYVEDHSTPPPSMALHQDNEIQFQDQEQIQFQDQEQEQVSSMAIQPTAIIADPSLPPEYYGDMLFTQEEISYLERLLSNGAHQENEIQFQDQEQEQVSSILAIKPTAIVADPSQPPDYDWTMAVPLGMKFRPTDVELINNYLKVEYVNGYVPRGIISSLDVYDYEPDQLPALAVDHGDGKYYFFTRVKKIGKSNYCERIIKSKTGFWKATQSPKPIRDENETKIGYKLSLTYYNNKKKTPWLMNEYRLEFNSEHSSELVLAVIYYHQKKNAE